MSTIGAMQRGVKDHQEFPGPLAWKLLDYAQDVSCMETPKEVLARLDAVTSESLQLNVGCAIRFPRKVMDWASLSVGKTVFLHGQTARGYWEDWIRQVPQKLPVGYALASVSLSPYALSESMRMLQPIGVDRWGFELALKHGVRDGFICPVGGRWVLFFWSGKPIANALTQPTRIMLFGAASFAAMRLDQLAGLTAEKANSSVTPRELAVLRLLSAGEPFKGVAAALGLGEETVRTHLKKVQAKLGVRNRTHAVAEAIRQQLIA